MRRQTLHLTLAFLGNVSSEMAEKALALAGALRCDPFDFRLDRLACWRHNHIVWIGCSVVPAALAGLAADLARTLAGAEFQLEKRSFAAHITLLRNARCPESLSEPEPILWQARDFVLVESKLSAQGANYEIVGRWPLG